MMNCKTCQLQMAAYLHGEMPRVVGQLMARHIQQCPACYAAYVQQRDIERELAHYVPLIGREKAPRYGKMWASIQGDLSGSRKQGYQVRYGLAALMLMLAVALPWTLGRGQTMLAAVPTLPSPEATATHTPERGGARVMVTLASVLYAAVTPEAEPQLARAPGAPDGTP